LLRISSGDNLGGKEILFVFVTILAAIFLFYLYQSIVPFYKTQFHLLDVLFLVGELVCGILSIAVVRSLGFISDERPKNHPSKVFGKGFLALGIAFFMYFLGELTFILNEVVLKIDPYPSYSDVFYFAFFPFAFYHVYVNLKFFGVSHKKTVLITIITILFFTVIYSVLSDEKNFDFWYGLINVIGSSTILGLGFSALSVFRNSLLGKIWVILVMGIIMKTIGDVWYSYLEIFDQYTAVHPVNLFWISAWIVIGFSLIRHSRLDK
jgi:hypothetical protein